MSLDCTKVHNTKTDAKKDIKIAFFDIDGTLIDIGTKVVSRRMLDTLTALKKNGIKICIATGRAPDRIPHFDGVEFDAFLAFNASYCFTGKEIIFSNPIPSDDVKRIIQNASELGRPVSVATAKRSAANGRDQDLIDYYAISKQTVEVADDFDILMGDTVYQLMLGSREEEYGQLLKGVTGAKITSWWPRAVDVIPANGSKGVGVEKVLEYFHLNKENAIAFGDGTNDIEMLATVGTGIAMGNATEDVKEMADDICGDVAEDGIYHYCKAHGLI